MTSNVQPTAGVPRAVTAALVLAVFTVSVGYGVVLPLLPGRTLAIVVTGAGAELFAVGSPAGSITIPLASMAILAALVGIVVAFAVPGWQRSDRSERALVTPAVKARPLIMRLLVLTFIVSTGLGVFEVGLALRGTQELNLTSYQVALMCTECSLVMFAAQAVVFSPWISTRAGTAQGWELGRQAAAASLGITIGSAAGGLLFDIGGVRGASFVLTTGLVAVGLLLSLTLPHALAPEVFGPQPHRKDTP